MKRLALIVSLFASCAGHCFGQATDLPRHGVAGLTIAAADPNKLEDPQSNPPTVKAVAPGGAGQAAGIEAGDAVRTLDGAPVSSSIAFALAISRHMAGDSLRLTLLRNGAQVEKTVVLKPRPYETSADADVIYSSVSVEGARRRTIITRPKSPGRHPALLLIGGLGCYSLDGELARDTGYGPLLSALAKQNYVTMRVDKPGEGDSEGPACTDPAATAQLEAQGYVAALRALKSYDYVDPQKIFIFAHSLGPLVASLVLPSESVHGFIGAETVGRSWFEYTLENIRRQAPMFGEPLDEVDQHVRSEAICGFHFFIEHETPEQVEKLDPQCNDMIASYAGVPYTYLQQIGDISLAKQWKNVDIPVLVIYGSSDPATSADESRYLVELMNSFHPGRASYAEIPMMGHDFGRYTSQSDFLNRGKNPNVGHPYVGEMITTVMSWLQQHS